MDSTKATFSDISSPNTHSCVDKLHSLAANQPHVLKNIKNKQPETIGKMAFQEL
jgi:hypothetical protein